MSLSVLYSIVRENNRHSCKQIDNVSSLHSSSLLCLSSSIILVISSIHLQLQKATFTFKNSLPVAQHGLGIVVPLSQHESCRYKTRLGSSATCKRPILLSSSRQHRIPWIHGSTTPSQALAMPLLRSSLRYQRGSYYQAVEM